MQTKICPICQTVFNKPSKTSSKQWSRRFCCSMSCAAKYRGSPWLEKHKMKKGSQLGKSTQFKKGEGRGYKNINWKGDKVGYYGLHTWIQRQYGKPQFCEECKTSERRLYHWANISGKYLRDRNDWKRMCVPCHKKFDLQK